VNLQRRGRIFRFRAACILDLSSTLDYNGCLANEKQRQIKQWTGCLVDNLFRLDQFLGEGETGVVFSTDFSRRRAAIKLIPLPADGAEFEADAQLALWQAAARLNHPHLTRILASGRSAVKGTPVVYIVTEYAEETLAQVLAERRLTPIEARDVLVTALDTLAYLHAQGLAHGHVKASNFLAVGDQLKLSSDGIAASTPGRDVSPEEDVKMLGAVFADALAKPLPQPFLDITRHALDPNPRTRWTISEIATRLDGRMPVRAPAPKRHVLRYSVPLAAAIVVAATLFIIARSPRRPDAAPPPAPVVAQSPPPTVSQTEPPAAAKSEPDLPPPPPQPAPARPSKPEHLVATEPTTQGIVAQPMPDVPPQATRTIHGTVLIPVRVDVDPSGNVTGARLDSQTGSRYFANFALAAARQWKFAPSGAPEAWLLRFEFTRENTKVSPAHIRP
jgi:TonB family protein